MQSSVYDTNVLTKVVSPRLLRRIEEKRFRDDVKEAGMEMWNCAKCGTVRYLDKPSLSVYCPQCTDEYCTKCDRLWHNNKTCKEVKAEERRLKDPLLLTREKMSEATIRRCPKCQIPFVKGDKCNKMTCNDCDTLSCYLCGIKIPGYSHFCDCKKRYSCGKDCKLFTSTPDMIKHERDARRKAGSKVLKAAGKTEDEIEKILKSPPLKKKKNHTPVNPQRNVGNGPASPVVPAGNPGNIQPHINHPQNLGMEQRPYMVEGRYGLVPPDVIEIRHAQRTVIENRRAQRIAARGPARGPARFCLWGGSISLFLVVICMICFMTDTPITSSGIFDALIVCIMMMVLGGLLL